MNKDISQLVAIFKRVPLFSGLQLMQAVTLLKACERRSLSAGEMLCQFGDRSDSMYILLSGELSVRTKDNTQIAKVSPVEPIGEMGLFTDEPRSATLVATKDSSLFVLGKNPLEGTMRNNKDIEITLCRNVISALAERLRTSHEELDHLRQLISGQGPAAV